MSALEKALTSTPGHHELTRSVSDAHSSAMSKHHHHHHLHHPHLPGHRRREHHSVSPALHPGSASADRIYDPKFEATTPNGSRRGSRRQSILGREDLDGNADAEVKERPQIKLGQIKQEKEKSALRATELRESLIELNTLSNSTTRQLDNVYYSVLEKHSVLQSTIASMQELALVARKLDEDFKSESNEIVSEVDIQLQGFQNFEDQRQEIEGYAARIGTGRERVKSLCDRLEAVKAKVEKWEQSEGEWQQRTRQRLRILWTIVITCVLIFVALLIFQYSPPVRNQREHTANVTFDVLQDEEVVNAINESLGSKKMLFERERPELGEDPRLRLFDEL